MKDRIGRKTDCNEKQLFHGTSQLSPAIVFSGDDGFDMRHSKEGKQHNIKYVDTNANNLHRHVGKSNIFRTQRLVFK